MVAPELRAEVSRRVCAATASILAAAEPGSDQQLAHARTHIESAVDPQRLARIAEILAGRAEIAGLRLEGDLRWAAVIRLAGQGTAGEELVASELAADPTQQGAAVRGPREGGDADARRPSGRPGMLRWRAAGCPTSCSPRRWPASPIPTRRPTCSDPYRPLYAAQIAGLFVSRATGEAVALARGLFPPIDPATVDVADTLLATPDLPAGLRRVLLERRDDVLRALACQEVSRAAG